MSIGVAKPPMVLVRLLLVGSSEICLRCTSQPEMLVDAPAAPAVPDPPDEKLPFGNVKGSRVDDEVTVALELS